MGKRPHPPHAALLVAALLSAVAAVAVAVFAAQPATRPAPSAAAPSPGSVRPKSDEQYHAYAMTHQGDATRGKALFLDDGRLACGRCHAVDGTGGRAGPDLFAVGDKFGRRDLIDSVLRPSATIAMGYSTTVVTTRSGDVYDGILKDATDRGVSLAGVDGRVTWIAAEDIRRRRTTNESLMPEGLHAGLTAAEFADLIDYLASLKVPETAAAGRHGAPVDIPESDHPVTLRPFHEPALRFAHPVWFGPVPGVPGGFAVAEHETGTVWLLHKDPHGDTKTVFVETGKFLRGTRGLLGMVFHPRYATNRRYFVAKHLVQDGHFSTHLLEGEAAADLRHDSGRPLRELMTMDATADVHYGGSLEFGPDGYLYVGMGDSGPQQDPRGNGQNLAVLLGKMLRIDVDHPDPDGGRPYAIPPDNPFVGRPGARPEVWACGFREPWRFSFDPPTGDLWVGDVGQDLFEEIDIVRRGENYGWNVYEGFEPFSNQYRRPGETYVPPVFAYNRKYGVSVTGGYVYRADPKSPFDGVYVFGDYQSARLFGLTQERRKLKQVRQIGKSPERIVSFGRDDAGELYLVGYDGTIYRIDFAGARFE